MPEELWMEVCNIVQEVVTKSIPKKTKCKKAKCLSEESLEVAEKRKEAKGKGERERHTQNNRQVWPEAQNKTGQRLKRIYNNSRDNSTHGYHQMVNTKIRFWY